ncbi:MAG: hypothetical protein OES46_16280 [Gammaproteobacteria bacterium]|jgi:hypothetical protein|nr:hypothetical protein [Gammaproteobacteria bacterium]
MKSGLISLALIVVAMATLGCSKIQEPWVSSDQQLRDERSRSVEQQQDLRRRIMTSQIER